MACGVTWFHAASNMDGLTCASHAPRLSSVPRASLGQWMLRPQIPCRPSQDAVVRRPLAHEACLSLFAGNRMSLTRSGQLSTGRNRFSDIQSRYYVHAAETNASTLWKTVRPPPFYPWSGGEGDASRESARHLSMAGSPSALCARSMHSYLS